MLSEVSGEEVERKVSNRKQGKTGESLGKSAKKSKVEIDKVKQQKGQKEKMTVKKKKRK